jgi:methyl-accepting chemotaxis protein
VLAAIEHIDQLITQQNQVSAAERGQRTRLMLAVFCGTLLLACLAAWLLIRQICTPCNRPGHGPAIGEGDLSASNLGHATTSSANCSRPLSAAAPICAVSCAGSARPAQSCHKPRRPWLGVIERTSSGAASQQSETRQVAAAMSQMACAVQEVAHNSSLASEATRQATDKAELSQQVVCDTQRQVAQLAHDITSSTEAVQQLSASAEQISSIMTLSAGGRADQPAGPERGHRGCARRRSGRGFAVVADEVRGLALRTQRSTAEIEVLTPACRTVPARRWNACKATAACQHHR